MAKTNRAPGQVTVQVKGKNVSVKPALREQVIAKMGRLDKYLDRLDHIEIELSTAQTRQAAHQNCVEATAYVLGRTIRVTSNDSDMHAAVDEAVDKLYRQLNRRKEQVKSHHGVKLADTMADIETEEPEVADPSSSSRSGEPVIRIERLDVKPQFEDEAIEQLESEGHDFYVFINARDERVNVLYRHPNGGYGLIQPIVG